MRTWRPLPLSWLETVLVGLTVGLVAYAVLAAFTPEVHSDAVRQHLPLAREIWQTGAARDSIPGRAPTCRSRRMCCMPWRMAWET